MDNTEEAIEFVMDFYNIDRDTCIKLYWDEVQAFMNILKWRINYEQTNPRNCN